MADLQDVEVINTQVLPITPGFLQEKMLSLCKMLHWYE